MPGVTNSGPDPEAFSQTSHLLSAGDDAANADINGQTGAFQYDVTQGSLDTDVSQIRPGLNWSEH